MRLLISVVAALALTAIGVLLLAITLPQNPAKIVILVVMGALGTGVLSYSIHAFIGHRRE